MELDQVLTGVLAEPAEGAGVTQHADGARRQAEKDSGVMIFKKQGCLWSRGLGFNFLDLISKHTPIPQDRKPLEAEPPKVSTEIESQADKAFTEVTAEMAEGDPYAAQPLGLYIVMPLQLWLHIILYMVHVHIGSIVYDHHQGGAAQSTMKTKLELTRLAKQKAAKVQSAQALLAKASADPKVRKQLKPKRGRGGRGRGRGTVEIPKATLGDLGEYEGEQDEEVDGNKNINGADQNSQTEPTEVAVKDEKKNTSKAKDDSNPDADLKKQWGEKDLITSKSSGTNMFCHQSFWLFSIGFWLHVAILTCCVHLTVKTI